MEWLLEIALVVLLAATLYQAMRLERALGVLKRDRASLEQLVAGFNASTQQAEQSIERLRMAADGTGRQIARQLEVANGLKGDLVFLTERGDRLADRLEGLVRSGRGLVPEAPRGSLMSYAEPEPREDLEPAKLRSQAELDLIKALRMAR